jgi:hypothetical protein
MTDQDYLDKAACSRCIDGYVLPGDEDYVEGQATPCRACDGSETWTLSAQEKSWIILTARSILTECQGGLEAAAPAIRKQEREKAKVEADKLEDMLEQAKGDFVTEGDRADKLEAERDQWKQDNLRMTLEHDRLDNTIGPLRRALRDSEELTEAVRGALATARDERDQARKQRDQELRERLLSDAMLDAITEAAFGPYAGPLPRAKLREVLLVALDFTKPLDSIFEETPDA